MATDRYAGIQAAPREEVSAPMLVFRIEYGDFEPPTSDEWVGERGGRYFHPDVKEAWDRYVSARYAEIAAYRDLCALAGLDPLARERWPAYQPED